MSSEAAPAQIQVKVGKYRWVVVMLLFAALTINYIDRQQFAVLKPNYLVSAFHWTDSDYATLVAWFQGAYAFAYVFWGGIIDRIGARFGFAAAFTIWTVAHIMHSGVRTSLQWTAARVALGVGEAGAFPGGIKAVTDWFPKQERALATGIFNAGTNIGAIITPLIVPWIVVDLGLGWRASFVIIGVASLLWLPAWFLLYAHPRKSKNVMPAELAFIEKDPPDPVEKISVWRVLAAKETWAFAIGKFLIDPVWWMFLFWLPDFLHREYNLDLKSFGPPLVIIYLISDIGSVSGGWLSSTLLKHGMSLSGARKTAMLVCGLLALPVFFAANASSLWVAVAIIGVATAAHQGFSCNLYTLPGDVFPRSAVGTVIGIGGAAGGVGGMLFSGYIGHQLEQFGGYQSIFAVAATTYLVALLIVHLITPRYAPAKLT